MKSPITTHVLDTALGRPASHLEVVLERMSDDGSAEEIARGSTDDDGRIMDLLPAEPVQPGSFRIHFATGPYFEATGRTGFYPTVVVSFVIRDPSEHYHVPLLLSPYGYSTYRGS